MPSIPPTSFYSESELATLGLKSYGREVLISRKASLLSPGQISIGNHVRIDDFALLSGEIKLGSYVHLSAFVALYGTHGIHLEDYCGISAHSTVYSVTDDFSGKSLIGPMVPAALRNVTGGLVHFQSYTQLGANNVVMPGVTLHEGAVTGALCFVNSDLPAWTISVGIPNRVLKKRQQTMLSLVKRDPKS